MISTTLNLDQLLQAVWETVYMTFFSLLFAVILGLVIGILLYITETGGLLQNRVINRITVSSSMCCVPFRTSSC